MNKLNDELRTQAVNLGLCRQWQNDWKEDWSKKELVEKYFEGIDFCIMHGYPSRDFIKRYFDRDMLRRSGVYVDDRYSNMNQRNVAGMGSSQLTLRYSGLKSGRMWIMDDTCLHLITHNFAFVLVHVFDRAQVKVENHDKSRVAIIVHSEQARLEYGPGVAIKEELNYLRHKISKV